MTDSGKRTFLTRRDRWGHGMATWIIALVVLALPPIFWAMGQIHMHNDVADWLPHDDPQRKIHEWYQTNFPSEDRVLLSWDDCTLTDSRLDAVAEHLEGRLMESGTREGASPFVSEVSLPGELLGRMLDRNVSFDTAVSRVNGLLCGPGPLRLRLSPDVPADETVRARLLQVVREVAGPETHVRLIDTHLAEPSTQFDRSDSSAGKLYDELTAWVRRQPEFDLSLSWPDMHAHEQTQAAAISALKELKRDDGKPLVEEAFLIPGSQAAMTVTLSDAGVEDEEGTFRSIREACLAAGVAEENLRLGGRPVVGAQLNKAVARAGWNREYELWDFPHRSPVLFSAVISIVLSLILLKSLRLAILVQVAANLTVVASVALVPVTGGSMNMVLVVMPTLLMVLTTSAAIHLANYWKHARSSDEHDSVIEAASTAWLPCILASGTTAIGLGSLHVSNLVPVSDFGTYAAIGCLISFFMVLYLVPSLMLYWRRKPPPSEQLDTRVWNRLGMVLTQFRYPVAVLCIIATVSCGYGLNYFRTETKVIRYFPPESRLFQDYVFLEDNLSGIISVDTIVRFSRESQKDEKNPRGPGLSFLDRARTVMNLQQKIRQHPEISGTLSLASFLDIRDPKDRTLKLSRFQRSQLRVAQKESYERVYDQLKEGGAEARNIASLLSLPESATESAFPGQPKLNEAGDELWRISAQAAILSDVDLEVLTGELDEIADVTLATVDQPGISHVVTGLIPIFLRTQQAVLESLINSFGLAFVLIAIVMMILLRSIRAGLLTMLPNLMPVIIVFGLLSWARLRVDIGTMITASVALGIAVDGTLHLITWFQELIRRGMSVPEAVAGALEHCGPAMWQTSAVVGLGMLALLPAELLLISRFGWMLAALIFAALLSDIIFLPALLAGPLGGLIQRSVQRRMSQASEAQKKTADTPSGLGFTE